MPPKSDFYGSHYAEPEGDVLRAIRAETFGEDLGQTSWITSAEVDEFGRWLALRPGQRLLEVACGTGGVAARLAEASGAAATGVDLHPSAVQAAARRAQESPARERLAFRVADADEPLPFGDRTFDALFSNDAVNHLRDRRRVLADWARLLEPGGRCLFTDPVVVTGELTNAEIARRSAIGFILFTPRGVNEAYLAAAGLRVVRVEDVTAGVAHTSGRWHAARAKRSAALCALEGEQGFEDFQRFLATVHALSSERRLSRFAYLAEKPAQSH
jgi:SAM-dependent methyltransferase